MKKLIAIALAVVMLVGLIPTTAVMAAKPVDDSGIYNGNGAPSGQHYNLNIIGVQNTKTTDMDTSNGHVIFVNLTGNTKIELTEGDFAVLDANGTDGTAAFQLPNPDPDNTGNSEYSVFARVLGTPGGKGNMTTGAEYYDPTTGETLTELSVISLPLERNSGKQTFENVTKYLLYIYVDLDGNGTAERYNLFNDALQNYFWSYDNNGLKVVQLRFYPNISTLVPETAP